MSEQLNSIKADFNDKFQRLQKDYIGFFDTTNSVKLKSLFRDQVQQDINSLYVTAQAAVIENIDGHDAANMLFSLEEIDVLLDNANLSRDNISHNFQHIREYLSDSVPDEMPTSFDP